jgi:hypothetical protein
MLKIRFLIPIFLIDIENDKYIITEKSFKYLKYLQLLFKEKVEISFLILGSENELSYNLTLKYFSEDEYMHYNQGGIHYLNRVSYEILNDVVGGKISAGYEKCKEFNPDLIIFMKNNHFISKEWLDEIINNYNNDPFSNNYYGMNFNNLILVTTLNNNKIACDENNEKFAIIDKRNSDIGSLFTACLLGIPRSLYLKHTINPIGCTEVAINFELMSIGGNPYYNLPTHILNIKSSDDHYNVTDMASLTFLYKAKSSKEINIYNTPNNEFIIRDINIIENL